MVFAALFGAAACRSTPAMPAAESAPARRSVPVLPLPALVEARSGAFTVGADTPILVPAGNADAQRIGELLSGYVQQVRGLKLVVGAEQGAAAGRPAIVLAIDPQAGGAGDEGYELEVSPQGMRVACGKRLR